MASPAARFKPANWSREASLISDLQMGRPGRVPGTRELVIAQTPYVVPYLVQGAAIQILRVYHGARRWPEGF